MKFAKILIIEDEKSIKELLKEFLELSFPEIEIWTAGTLEEAQRLWQEGTFDLIISDCLLPDGLACEFLERTNFQGPVIIFTGLVDPEDLEKAVRSLKGPVHILRKPISLEKLTHILESLER